MKWGLKMRCNGKGQLDERDDTKNQNYVNVQKQTARDGCLHDDD